MSPLITIAHLNHYFGKNSLRKQILYDINLTIDPGEIVIMTGPSGSGKTTLLTLIGALRSVQEGSLTIAGQEIKGASNQTLVQTRRTIGYIFQAHNLLPFMTARQNVRMSLALGQHADQRRALQKVDEVLDAVGLGDHLNQHPDKLSGGQKQRVAIARALVNEPAMLLADEPTASLDSKTGRDVVELMYGLAKNQHCTILLVTHDHRILDIADRTIHLEDGRLKAVDQPAIPSAQTLFSLNQRDVAMPSLFPVATPNTNGNAVLEQRDRSRRATPDHAEPAIAQVAPETNQAAFAAPTVAPTMPPAASIDDSGASPKPFLVACIDGSAALRQRVKTFLADAAFPVSLIGDPFSALTELIKVPPNIILLDLTMPSINGFQLCKLIRSHPLLIQTPIILLVDEAKPMDLEIAEAVGANDYLMKSFDQSELIMKLFPYLG